MLKFQWFERRLWTGIGTLYRLNQVISMVIHYFFVYFNENVDFLRLKNVVIPMG